MDDFITLKATCRCQQLKLSVDVPAASLPLPLIVCHCNTCNAVTGQLCATVCAVPDGAKPWKITGEATGYKTSNAIERFFCGTCGTSVYEDAAGLSPPTKFIDTGAFSWDKVTVSGKSSPIFKLGEHIFVGDAKDGGLRDWMADVKAWEGWSGQSKEIATGSSYGPTKSTVFPYSEDELKCECKCSGVKFTITRPEASSGKFSSPTIQDTAGSPVATMKRHDWWKPRNRYNAFLCACNDCRLSSGNEISAWAMIPKNNFKVDVEVSPENYEDLEAATTLKSHQSSPGVVRQFCGRCGASLGFVSEQMPNLINVSVGLMNSKSGPRCEEWLEWNTNGIGYEDLAQNKEFIKTLSDGFQKWGAQQLETRA